MPRLKNVVIIQLFTILLQLPIVKDAACES